MAHQRFVKSATTKTSIESSRAELQRVLHRYGCTAFGYEEDGESHVTMVHFRVPDRPGSTERVPVKLEVRIADVAQQLYGAPPKHRRWGRGSHGDCPPGERWPEEWAQAERVAWRHLVLWVDAACSAALSGLTTMEEAFLAHRLIRLEDGRAGRVIDYLRTVEGSGARLLLGDGAG